MPEHKPCKKRLLSDAKKRNNNKYVKKTIKTSIKKLRNVSTKEEMEKAVNYAKQLNINFITWEKRLKNIKVLVGI